METVDMQTISMAELEGVIGGTGPTGTNTGWHVPCAPGDAVCQQANENLDALGRTAFGQAAAMLQPRSTPNGVALAGFAQPGEVGLPTILGGDDVVG
jgi:hypothetical protein